MESDFTDQEEKEQGKKFTRNYSIIDTECTGHGNTTGRHSTNSKLINREKEI